LLDSLLQEISKLDIQFVKKDQKDAKTIQWV